MIFEIFDHLLSLGTSWNSREESNQIFGKDLLAKKKQRGCGTEWSEIKWMISTAREVLLFELAVIGTILWKTTK